MMPSEPEPVRAALHNFPQAAAPRSACSSSCVDEEDVVARAADDQHVQSSTEFSSSLSKDSSFLPWSFASSHCQNSAPMA
eukprot:4133777-Pleurochrysis_carterae.AAC.1